MKSSLLVSALGSIVKSEKRASILVPLEEAPAVNIDLQNMVGDAHSTYTSTFTQFRSDPDGALQANPMSPVEDDFIFFAYLIPGAVFQAHDGSQWMILDYTFEGAVHIENRWYPRLRPIVSVQDVRRSIAAWVEPVQQTVPVPPVGVDYGIIRTRETQPKG